MAADDVQHRDGLVSTSFGCRAKVPHWNCSCGALVDADSARHPDCQESLSRNKRRLLARPKPGPTRDVVEGYSRNGRHADDGWQVFTFPTPQGRWFLAEKDGVQVYASTPVRLVSKLRRASTRAPRL